MCAVGGLKIIAEKEVYRLDKFVSRRFLSPNHLIHKEAEMSITRRAVIKKSRVTISIRIRNLSVIL